MIEARVRKRDGRRVYDVRLRDDDGIEYSKTFLTKREAQEFEAAERTDRRRGEWIDPRLARTRLNELADHWLASNPAKRPRTLERDREIVSAALAALGPSRRVVSITRADVQRLVDNWRAELAPSTVRRMFSALRAMFNYAEAAEFIARSPCRHIRLPSAELVERPALNADPLSAVAGGLGDHGAMVWLGAVLGLRWGEVAGLTVGDIDFLRGEVVVKRQLGRDRRLSEPKSTAGRRRIATPAWLLDELSALLAARRLTAADADALVFVNLSGGPLNYSAWRRTRWASACRAATLEGLRFHDLRSVAASALVAAGVDLKPAQRRLGHANVTMTLQVYARATEEADRRASDLVGERFRPRDKRGMEG